MGGVEREYGWSKQRTNRSKEEERMQNEHFVLN